MPEDRDVEVRIYADVRGCVRALRRAKRQVRWLRWRLRLQRWFR